MRNLNILLKGRLAHADPVQSSFGITFCFVELAPRLQIFIFYCSVFRELEVKTTNLMNKVHCPNEYIISDQKQGVKYKGIRPFDKNS